MFKDKMAVIIPTKDRPRDLKRLLESIALQEVRPIQIIIVDAGSTSVQKVLDEFPGFDIDYAGKIPASLTNQRNIGIRMLRSDVTLVAFFDDDVELEEGCLMQMMNFWDNAPLDVGGISLNVMTESFKRPTFFEKMFLVNAEIPGKILKSGYQSLPSHLKETIQVDWLIGCAMVFRKNIFDDFMFDEWFSGYAHYEDVDFSFRVGKMYKLFLVADARVKHFIKLEKVENSFQLGRMQIINRFYFVRKNPSLSMPLCCWASLGLFFNNLLKGLLNSDVHYIFRAKGNLSGAAELFSRKFAFNSV